MIKYAALFLLVSAQVMADPADLPPPDRGFTQTFVMLALGLLLFYFIAIRPESKRRKNLENIKASLKKGDRVTAVGIIGTVAKVQENTVLLRMYDGSKIEVLKGAITDVMPGTEEDARSADTELKH